MTTESIAEETVTNTSSPEVTLPLDPMMTSQDVCDLLKINRHTLSTNRKIWADILPPIRFKGSNLIRYRRSDVMRLIEGGSTSSSHEVE